MLSEYAREDAPRFVASKNASPIPESLLRSGPAVIPVVVDAGVTELEEFGLYNIMLMSMSLPPEIESVTKLIDEVRRLKSHVPEQIMRLANRIGAEGAEAVVADMFSSPKHSALGALALMSSNGLPPSAIRLLRARIDELVVRYSGQFPDDDTHRLAELALLVLSSSGDASAADVLKRAASKNQETPSQYRQNWITEAWLFLTDAWQHMPK